MFSDEWVLHTHPNTPEGSRQVLMRGAAVEPNVQGRERRKLSRMLAEKEKQSKVPLQCLHCPCWPVLFLLSISALSEESALLSPAYDVSVVSTPCLASPL